MVSDGVWVSDACRAGGHGQVLATRRGVCLDALAGVYRKRGTFVLVPERVVLLQTIFSGTPAIIEVHCQDRNRS